MKKPAVYAYSRIDGTRTEINGDVLPLACEVSFFAHFSLITVIVRSALHDKQAVRLMAAFYEKIWEGMGKYESV